MNEYSISEITKTFEKKTLPLKHRLNEAYYSFNYSCCVEFTPEIVMIVCPVFAEPEPVTVFDIDIGAIITASSKLTVPPEILLTIVTPSFLTILTIPPIHFY